MGYQFQQNEKMIDGIRRIVIEQIDNIIERLSPPFETPDADVHDSRKSFKKIRAVLELISGDLPKKTYQQERRFYRDLAQQLAGARESYVALQTFEALLDQHKPIVGAKRQYAKVRNSLKNDYEEKAAATFTQDDPYAGIVADLQVARERVNAWSFRHRGYNVIMPGLQQVYDTGAQRMKRAYADVDDIETYHDWRKSVKLLWYHMRLLSPTWQVMVEPLVFQLDDLGEILGSEHDHSELKIILEQLPDDRCEPEALNKLLTAIEIERKQLRVQAFLIGQLVYAEEGDTFVRRHRAYWKRWRKPLITQESPVNDETPITSTSEP